MFGSFGWLAALAPFAMVFASCGPLPQSTFVACNNLATAQARCFALPPADQNAMAKSCSEQYQDGHSGCAQAIEALSACLNKTPCSDLNQTVNACTSAAGTQAVMCAPSEAARNSNTRASRGSTFQYHASPIASRRAPLH